MAAAGAAADVALAGVAPPAGAEFMLAGQIVRVDGAEPDGLFRVHEKDTLATRRTPYTTPRASLPRCWIGQSSPEPGLTPAHRAHPARISLVLNCPLVVLQAPELRCMLQLARC